jgi:lipopolysaccharide transport system ATP-binding protein
MASLLEVGTGFHPELTGRENIYLNGAVLGMPREEIKRKFDEIVAFAEVEKFLDTPVKRYSSGMYVRLAFAVAAHLEPEILVVDEVLAVGDAEFQQKCLGKMGEVALGGRTVIFVSHNMAAIADLCSRSIHLSHGQSIADGDSKKVIAAYLASGVHEGKVDLSTWNLDRQGEQQIRIISLETLDNDCSLRSIFQSGDCIVFRIGILGQMDQRCTIGVSIRDNRGSILIHLPSVDQCPDLKLPTLKSYVDIKIEHLPLNEGQYYITIWLGDARNMLQDRVGNCLSFTVDNTLLGQSSCAASFCVSATWLVRAAGI